MQEVTLPFLAGWQNFYIIAGTASATLTGLMFIVITLIASIEGHRSTLDAAVSAFNTPTVIHFCAVLLVAAILSVPWQAFSPLSLVLGLAGLVGVIYLIAVIRRLRNVPGYETPLKDMLWYGVFPFLSYVAFIIAAAALLANPGPALYLIAAAMAWLLFVGIHNAWDLVIYLAIDRAHADH